MTEHQWTGTVNGHFLGIPGHGRYVTIRMLHVPYVRAGDQDRVSSDSQGRIALTIASSSHRSARSSMKVR